MIKGLFGGCDVYQQDRYLIGRLEKEHMVEFQEGWFNTDMDLHRQYPVVKIWLTYGGEVPSKEATTIELFVTSAPAQFWEAKIRPGPGKDGKPYGVTTGSGSLMYFWPMFFAIAENMLVPVQVEA